MPFFVSVSNRSFFKLKFLKKSISPYQRSRVYLHDSCQFLFIFFAYLLTKRVFRVNIHLLCQILFCNFEKSKKTGPRSLLSVLAQRFKKYISYFSNAYMKIKITFLASDESQGTSVGNKWCCTTDKGVVWVDCLFKGIPARNLGSAGYSCRVQLACID